MNLIDIGYKPSKGKRWFLMIVFGPVFALMSLMAIAMALMAPLTTILVGPYEKGAVMLLYGVFGILLARWIIKELTDLIRS